MSKKNEARRKSISIYLKEHEKAKVTTLAQYFKVTTETIRKDLAVLEQRGVIKKNHGWVQKLNTYAELPIDVKIEENMDLKERIAKKALDFIENGSLIYLDPGSTTLILAKYLPLKKNLTIVTTSLPIAQKLLGTHHEILFLGGKVQKKGSTTVGSFALENLNHIRIDTAFMGTDGFKGCSGPTTFSYEELVIKQKVILQAKKKILLCDATKFQKTGTYPFAHFYDYDTLITNPISYEEKQGILSVKEILMV